MSTNQNVINQPLLIIVLASLILASCSSTTGPVTIRESTNVDDISKNNKPNTNNNEAEETNLALVKPVRPDAQKTTVPIIERLVEQANQQYRANNYNMAINTAERGLRINRKEPRFYLALTKSYKKLNNNQQSIHFAKQGLRYAKKNSPVFFELKKMSAS